MGKVKDELSALLCKQLDDHGIIVWYDPEKSYTAFLGGADFPNTTMLKYEESFFELRARLEPLLEYVKDDGSFDPAAETAPRVLIYLPLAREASNHALVEAEAAGVVLEPGANPWQRNTRLKVIAERVFRCIAPERASQIAADVEAGRLSLDELDWLADESGDLGAVKLIFGTTSLLQVALPFLCSSRFDAPIREKDALSELAALFHAELGVKLEAQGDLAEMRRELVRGLLLGELGVLMQQADAGSSPLPVSLIPAAERQREALLALCREWRNRLDLREDYVLWADQVESGASLEVASFPEDALGSVETFAFVEGRLLRAAEQRLLAGLFDEVLKLATARKSSFWSLQKSEYQLRWSVLESAALVQLRAKDMLVDLKKPAKEPAALIEAYTRGLKAPEGAERTPWCLLDRSARHLEYRLTLLEAGDATGDGRLEQVLSGARRAYTAAAASGAEAFLDALVASRFECEGVLRQEDVCQRRVRPAAGEGKTAYLLVDGLRYEMGAELVEGLSERCKVTLEAGLAQLPSITVVGMAALMPAAERGLELLADGRGCAVRIGESVLRDRASRLRYFEESFGAGVVAIKLGELVKPARKLAAAIAEAQLMVVTSQEIDRRGEEVEDEEEARRYMEEVIEKLRAGIRRLLGFGFRRVIVAADHGHLFLSDPDPAMKIDAPGGETLELHSRVWIGRGGSRAPGFIRVKASEVGLAGDLELAAPRGLGVFKTRGGANNYLHGGASLQELIIPVAVIASDDRRAVELGSPAVSIKSAKDRITARFFSVEVCYTAEGMFPERHKRVKSVLRADRRDVGGAAMAAYGFEEGTQEVVLEKDRPNAVTMMLTASEAVEAVSVHVLDAVAQVELAVLKALPVSLVI